MNQDTISLLIQQGIQIGSQMQQSNTVIPNVDNSLIGAFISVIAGIIIRAIEKHKLRKQGKLTDKYIF